MRTGKNSMKFRWSYKHSDKDTILDQIKESREISDSFIHSSLTDLPSHSLLKDIDIAADRIIEAVHQKEKIIIYGHDDVDGITSTYILYDFLEKLGSQNHFYYIPNRLIDNHGIQQNFIDKVREEKFNLVITVDGGVSGKDAIAEIMELGCDVIITDHHIVLDDLLPPALAIVNPKQKECKFPFEMIAGVAVTYFLIKKIAEITGISDDRNYLFWVAIGSISDKVPLVDVNRIFVKEVLDTWNTFDDNTLYKLSPYLEQGINYSQRMNNIHFIIKLLSNGRGKNGIHKSMKLLTTHNKEKDIIIAEMQSLQKNHESKLENIRHYIRTKIPRKLENSFVFRDLEHQIPFELLGYSASFITKRHKVPVIFIKNKNGIAVGEARGTNGFNLVDAFTHCSEHLIQYGGHAKAAGFTVKSSEIVKFIDKFEEYIEQNQRVIEENKRIDIDAVISSGELDKFNEYIQMDYNLLQPFGPGNPEPKFLLIDYLPQRDVQRMQFKKLENKMEPEVPYNIVFTFRESSFKFIDYREKNYML
ncbi:MAG: DHH family phosphoesterase [Candidatus Cloacimonetes bacterium]|jgi:single-stranded-DNA-specific exonuclease|nr:DHH family phosphoesterase [Candidatus Cloacimonadota bacterium]